MIAAVDLNKENTTVLDFASGKIEFKSLMGV